MKNKKRYSNLHDKKLLSLWCKGDGDAFGELHNRCYEKVFLYVMGLTEGKREKSKEVIQDTFVKIVSLSIEQKKKIEDFEKYLFRSVRNNLFNTCRNEQSQAIKRKKITVNTHISTSFDELSFEAENLKKQLYAPLKNEEAKIIQLKSDGYNIDEIAEKTGRTKGSAKGKIQRIREKIRSAYQKFKEP